MPEDVVDIGVDDCDCRNTDTCDSASDEEEADMFAGEKRSMSTCVEMEMESHGGHKS